MRCGSGGLARFAAKSKRAPIAHTDDSRTPLTSGTTGDLGTTCVSEAARSAEEAAAGVVSRFCYSLAWIEQMHPALRRFMLYGLGRSDRIDFLRALDEEPPDATKHAVYARKHSVWETGPWMTVAACELVRHASGDHEIVPVDDVRPGDTVIGNRQVPCHVTTHENGLYSFEMTNEYAPAARVTVFERDDPAEYEQALREALPRLYTSFVPAAWQGSTTGLRRDSAPRRYAGLLNGSSDRAT